MACDLQTLADDSSCFLCSGEKQLLAAQAYSAWQAWRAVDPGAPATASQLFALSAELRDGTSHKALLAAIAYSLCNLNSP